MGASCNISFPCNIPALWWGAYLIFAATPTSPPRPPAPHLHCQATHAVSAEGELLESSPSGHVPSTEEPASTL